MPNITTTGTFRIRTLGGMGRSGEGALGESAFQRDTVVERAGAGRYVGTVPTGWRAPLIPQGGVVAAVGLRAMAAELDESMQRLRSATVAFAGQVREGPAEVDVQVLRRGRTLSQVVATVRNVGEEAGSTILAVYGTTRAGYEFTDLVPPAGPPPQDCPSFRDPPPPGAEDFDRPFEDTLWAKIDSRVVQGHPPWDDWEPDTSERVYWFHFDEPPVADDGRLDPLALVVLADTMPGAVFERVGPRARDHRGFSPSADLTVHLLADARPGWLLGRNRARHAGDGYASVEMELWDGATLVAYATQMMFFSFPDGPPPPEVLRAP